MINVALSTVFPQKKKPFTASPASRTKLNGKRQKAKGKLKLSMQPNAMPQ